MELRTPRLILRPIRPTDRAEFLRVCAVSWPAWQPWMPAPDPGDTFETLFDKYLARTDRELSSATGLPLVAFLPTGQIAGFFALSNLVRGAFQNAYAGWRVSADLHRQGYGLEGLTALLDHAFSEDGLAVHRVQANVIPANTPSLRLAERAGFRREGYALRYLRIAGQWQDHVMLAKLADEHTRASAMAGD